LKPLSKTGDGSAIGVSSTSDASGTTVIKGDGSIDAYTLDPLSGATNTMQPTESEPLPGRRMTLLEARVAAERSRYEAQLSLQQIAERSERRLAKQIGLLLLMTPYGAPPAVIVQRLKEDRLIAGRLPNLDIGTLEAFHRKYPELVPMPRSPVAIGSPAAPTIEGYLDFAIAMRLTGTASQGQTLVSSRRDLFVQRYGREDGRILAVDEIPSPNELARIFRGFTDKIGMRGVFLRRILLAAPPHWAPERIAEEFNTYRGYLEQFEHGTPAQLSRPMTAAEVSRICRDHPIESGARDHAARRDRVHRALVDALSNQAMNANLYETLVSVSADLEKTPRRSLHEWRQQYWYLYQHPFLEPREYDGVTFPPSPPAEVALDADDLFSYIAGQPSLTVKLNEVLGDRVPAAYRAMAEQIVETLGDRLSSFNIREIAHIMKKRDASYTEELIAHLKAEYPDILRALDGENARVERNFLIATHLADMKVRIWPGATRKALVNLLVAMDSPIAKVFSNLSERDIRLLEDCYDFVPKWDQKPEHLLPDGAHPTNLGDIIELTSAYVAGSDRDRLEGLVMGAMIDPQVKDMLPPAIQEQLRRSFAKGLLQLAAAGLGLVPKGVVEGRGNYQDAFRRWIGLDDRELDMDVSRLAIMLSDQKSFGLSPTMVDPAARLLCALRALDLPAIQRSLDRMGPSFSGELREKLTAGAFASELLPARIENDLLRNQRVRESLARSARIPLQMECTQKIVDKYKAEKPLAGHHVVLVQHILGQAYPQVRAYQEIGMEADKSIFVAIPYNPIPEVQTAVGRATGVDTRVPPKLDVDEGPLNEAIEKAIDETMERHFKDGLPVAIVCDGPYARRYFEKRWLSKHPELENVVSFTEQTAFGDRPEDRANTRLRVVSYARALFKTIYDSPHIGQAGARAISAVLTQCGQSLENKRVLMLGLSNVGRAAAAALAGDGAIISGYDPEVPEETGSEWLKKGRALVDDVDRMQEGMFMLVGCSGHRSVGPEQIAKTPSGTWYVSLSSKLAEYDIQEIEALATDDQGRVQKMEIADVNGQKSYAYLLRDGRILYVIAGTLPANFNDVNSVPPELIDFTIAASVASVVQATRKKKPGYDALNATDDRMICAEYEERYALPSRIPTA
jgi:S-adenosylhomocysteine hydrolase